MASTTPRARRRTALPERNSSGSRMPVTRALRTPRRRPTTVGRKNKTRTRCFRKLVVSDMGPCGRYRPSSRFWGNSTTMWLRSLHAAQRPVYGAVCCVPSDTQRTQAELHDELPKLNVKRCQAAGTAEPTPYYSISIRQVDHRATQQSVCRDCEFEAGKAGQTVADRVSTTTAKTRATTENHSWRGSSD